VRNSHIAPGIRFGIRRGLLRGQWASWRSRGMVFAVVVSSMIACTEDRPTEPGTISSAVPNAETCSAKCVLFTGVAPFLAARFRADSAAMPVLIGVIDVSGNAGASVTLSLSGEPELLQSIGRVHVLAERIGTSSPFSIAELQHGVTVYTFTQRGHVRLRYLLERRVAGSLAAGKVQLTQRLVGVATVLVDSRPWVSEGRPSLAFGSMEACAITDRLTIACDNTVTTSPFVPGGFPGSTFQSNPGNGQSQPITIRFEKPVRAVSIEIFDSDCSNNQMIASDGAGIIASLTFSFDNQPGNGEVIEVRTITAPEGRGITRVDLIPDPCEYVAYSGSWEPAAASITVACSPAPVTRGEVVTCTAAGANLVITKWSFSSSELSNSITLSTSSTTWSGVAAVSGTVTAEGTIDGAPQSGEGALSVQPRDWSLEKAAYAHREVPSNLPLRPTALGQLGDTRHFPDVDLLTAPQKYAQISEGPNTGVFYLVKVPLAVRSDIRVNRAALKAGSAFYKRQPAKSKDPSKCSQAQVEPFVAVIERHEGLHLESNSHTYLYRQKLDELAGPATEAIVSLNDLSDLFNKALTVGQPVFNAALANAARADTEFPPTYCLFRYF